MTLKLEAIFCRKINCPSVKEMRVIFGKNFVKSTFKFLMRNAGEFFGISLEFSVQLESVASFLLIHEIRNMKQRISTQQNKQNNNFTTNPSNLTVHLNKSPQSFLTSPDWKPCGQQVAKRCAVGVDQHTAAPISDDGTWPRKLANRARCCQAEGSSVVPGATTSRWLRLLN